MRKYIIGALIGFCISFAIGAHAEVMNMIGKTVEGTVDLTINNKKMEYQAILIDGTTYAPVRMLGEETGYIVKFDNEAGVKLTKKITTPKETVLKSIDVLNKAIVRNEESIKANKEELDRLKKEPQTEQVLMDIISVESSIKKFNEDITACRDQITKLNQTLADIDAQDTELNK